jgi:protein-tyrosine phosphatase
MTSNTDAAMSQETWHPFVVGGAAAAQKQQEEDDIVLPWIEATNAILNAPPFAEPKQLPVAILPWLYLSDMYAVRDADTLLQLGITHVLTTNGIRGEWEREEYERPFKASGVVVQHCIINGEDEEGYDMIGRHWEECKRFLEEVQKHPNGKVVVHCGGGENRSALITAAAMLLLDKNEDGERRTLLDVVRSLKSKRGIVLSNESFRKQLCMLAAREHRLGGKPPERVDEDPHYPS